MGDRDFMQRSKEIGTGIGIWAVLAGIPEG